MQKSNIRKSVLALAITQCFSINVGAATISLSGGCSLRDAIQSANTDTSVNGCAAGSGDDTISMLSSSTVTLTAVDPDGDMVAGLPTIRSNISIQGNGSTITRDVAAPGFRIFTVENNATFELQNTTITNGVGTGSAIQAVDANLIEISNSTVSNNSAGTVNGNAENSNIGINLRNTDLVLTDSVITQNSGTNNVGVFIESGNVTINNSQITHNTASNSNSGLYVLYGELNVTNSSISNNSANGNGGLTCYSPSNVAISQTQVLNNTGRDAGLYVYQGRRYGGLTMSVSDSSISKNNGPSSGLYIYAESDSEASQVTLSNVTVNQNTSNTSAGVDLIGSLLEVTATDLEIMQNQGGDNQFSGILISGGTTASIENLDLVNNTPNIGATTNRSGISVNGSNLTLTNSTLSNNNGQRVASAIYMSSYSNVQVIDTEITNNTMVDGHSGIHAPVHVDNSTLTLTNVTLDGNISARDGGAIHAGNGSSLSINSSTISNNFSPSAYGGGAMYLGYGTDTIISNSTLSGNRSGDGSAIKSVSSNTLTLTNVTVSNHDAATPESSIFTLSISGIQSQLSIKNSLFSGNSGDLCNTLLSGVSEANNWFEDDSCDGFGQGPLQLEALSDNGGPTSTHALPIGSPAIDTADSSTCLASPINGLDQRGERRGSLCDIGAYEFVDDTSFFVIRSADGKTITIAL